MELDTYLRFALALVFVLALIGIAAWLARKAGLGTRVAKTRNTRRRLSIVEVSAVDGKRRLVLVRRDGVEHLVLLGATGETVIETGIAPPPAETGDGEAAPALSFKSQVAARTGRGGAPEPAGANASTKPGAGKGAGG